MGVGGQGDDHETGWHLIVSRSGKGVMKLNWLACYATLAVVAIPVAAATTTGAALAAPLPRIAAPGAHPSVAWPVTVRPGGNVGPGGNVAGGAELWRARYGKPPNSLVYPDSTAVSPDGSQVYIAGTSAVAYDAATGAQRWAAPTGLSRGAFLGVSTDGSRVFVTGGSANGGGALRYTTRAFDAATGAVLWTAYDHGPGTGDDQARSLAVSPDGSRVFVTGSSSGPNGISRYTTIAYDAATGARRWVARYSNQHLSADAASVAVSPSGTQVFVTGGSTGPTGHISAATVSYDAATGATRWVARYSAAEGRDAGAGSVAVSPDGSAVYIAGTARTRRGQAFPQNIAVVAYAAATGAQRWAALYPGSASPPPVYGSNALAMALSPDGSAVFVAGQASTQRKALYNTVAFGAATGALRWARQAPLNGFGLPAGIAASNTEVFITGHTTAGPPATGATAYATVAYAAATGAERWTRLYTGSVPGFTQATSVAVSPDGTRVFVTGGATGPNRQPEINYTTLAYSP